MGAAALAHALPCGPEPARFCGSPCGLRLGAAPLAHGEYEPAPASTAADPLEACDELKHSWRPSARLDERDVACHGDLAKDVVVRTPAAAKVEQSASLGVSVKFLRGPMYAGIQEVFGATCDPDFYEINSAMVLGDGPREVTVEGLRRDAVRVNDLLLQDTLSTEVRGRVKDIQDTRMVMVETGTLLDPYALMQVHLQVTCKDKSVGAPTRMERRVVQGGRWPVGRGVRCPRDGREHTSLVDALRKKGGSKFVGESTVFLSHAWSCSASLVFSSLGEWCARNGHDVSETFVWTCIASVNQYRVQERRELGIKEPLEAFYRCLEDRVRDIGLVACFMDRWSRPAYTSRVWCHFELTAAAAQGGRVEFFMPSAQEASFLQALRRAKPDRLHSILGSFGVTKIEDADATFPCDRANILDAIASRGGAVRANKAFRTQVQEFLLRVAKSHAAEYQEDLCLQRNVRALFAKLGCLEDAARMDEGVLAFNVGARPANDPKVVATKLNLALTYVQLRSFERAAPLLEAVLKSRRETFPVGSPQLIAVMGYLADVQRERGHLVDASILQQEILDARRETLPPEDPKVVDALLNLAATCGEHSRHLDAAALFEEALELRLRSLPPDHLDVATAAYNLAVARAKLGKHEEAAAAFREALLVRRRALPPDHPDVIAASQGVASCLERCKRADEAAAILEDLHDKTPVPPP